MGAGRAHPFVLVVDVGRGIEGALPSARPVERAGPPLSVDLPDVAGDNFIARRRAIAVLGKQAAGEAVEVTPGQQELIDRWVERLEIPTERMNALANARAETLRDELSSRTGIEAERIFIAEPIVPDRPGIEVKISSHVAD